MATIYHVMVPVPHHRRRTFRETKPFASVCALAASLSSWYWSHVSAK